jgi:hypothetical protein
MAEWRSGFLRRASLCLVLASGSLGLARDAMFLIAGNVPADSGSAFWASVRICFVIAAVFAWLIEHQKVRDLEESYEPDDHLRRRTTTLVDELELFLRDRHSNMMMISSPSHEERNRAVHHHNWKTNDVYVTKFRARLLGIVEELRAKGVLIASSRYGFEDSCQVPRLEELEAIRRMASRSDRKDNAIRA